MAKPLGRGCGCGVTSIVSTRDIDASVAGHRGPPIEAQPIGAFTDEGEIGSVDPARDAETECDLPAAFHRG
jgi:hypothetical protein